MWAGAIMQASHMQLWQRTPFQNNSPRPGLPERTAPRCPRRSCTGRAPGHRCALRGGGGRVRGARARACSCQKQGAECPQLPWGLPHCAVPRGSRHAASAVPGAPGVLQGAVVCWAGGWGPCCLSAGDLQSAASQTPMAGFVPGIVCLVSSNLG